MAKRREKDRTPKLLAAEGSSGWHAFMRLPLRERSQVLELCAEYQIKSSSAFLADVDRYSKWMLIPFVDALIRVVELDRKHESVLGSGLPKQRSISA